MLLGIGIAFLVLTVAVAVYFIVLSPHADNASNLVSDSYNAMRSSDLRVSKDFDVHMRDTRIGDIFSAFPEDGNDVLTAQTIVDEVGRIRGDMARSRVKTRPLHYTT